MPKAFKDKTPVCCVVCKRAATGIGVSPRHNAPIAWLCDDTTCIGLGKMVYSMTSRDYNLHEMLSMSDAGDKAGAYLEQIGKTDIGALNREEWITFLKTILFGYEDAMRGRLSAVANGGRS